MGSTKKGIGYWSNDGVHHGLEGSGVTWCYDWGVSPAGKSVGNIDFVPMIWGKRNVNPKDLLTAKMTGKVLLAFNEPDVTNQSNMSVEEALRLWPQLEATGMRLGSPAASPYQALEGKWLDQFMQGVKTKGYRVDFICAHHYSPLYTDPRAAAEELKDYLTRIHAMYEKPIWLTEFALSNWKTAATITQQEAYVKEAVPMLEKLPFVERYAWFAFPPFNGDKGALANSHLTDSNCALNATGITYRDAK